MVSIPHSTENNVVCCGSCASKPFYTSYRNNSTLASLAIILLATLEKHIRLFCCYVHYLVANYVCPWWGDGQVAYSGLQLCIIGVKIKFVICYKDVLLYYRQISWYVTIKILENVCLFVLFSILSVKLQFVLYFFNSQYYLQALVCSLIFALPPIHNFTQWGSWIFVKHQTKN